MCLAIDCEEMVCPSQQHVVPTSCYNDIRDPLSELVTAYNHTRSSIVAFEGRGLPEYPHREERRGWDRIASHTVSNDPGSVGNAQDPYLDLIAHAVIPYTLRYSRSCIATMTVKSRVEEDGYRRPCETVTSSGPSCSASFKRQTPR